MNKLRFAINDLLGGPLAASKKIGVSQGAVSNWFMRNSSPSPLVCARIERATKGQVTRKDLRKDWAEIWPELVD